MLLFLGVRGYTFLKNLVNFFGFIYPLTGVIGGILYEQQSSLRIVPNIEEIKRKYYESISIQLYLQKENSELIYIDEFSI